MPVGNCSEFAAGCKNVRVETVRNALAVMGSREVHSHRSYAHHAAAPFAVVNSAGHFAAAVLKRGKAGGSRSTVAKKFFLLEQPARFGVTGGDQPGILLSHEPARVRGSRRAKKVRLLALQNRRDMRREHGLSGKECHLSVVGDGAPFPVSGSVVADSRFPVGAEDFVQVQKFNRGAESGADDAAEQASAEAGSHPSVGGDAGKGHFSV